MRVLRIINFVLLVAFFTVLFFLFNFEGVDLPMPVQTAMDDITDKLDEMDQWVLDQVYENN